jgi:hypothetical protein
MDRQTIQVSLRHSLLPSVCLTHHVLLFLSCCATLEELEGRASGNGLNKTRGEKVCSGR